MNKLIINGDAWGEFTGSTKKKDGNIEIRGYRSYDTLHTVRVMDHPEGLNSNQQIVLDWMKDVFRENEIDPFTTILDFLRPTTQEDELDSAYASLSQLNNDEQFQVLAAFAAWGQSEVQDDTEV